MPEVTAGRIPGAGGALFLKRRTPFRERLGEGLAGAAETIGGGLMQRGLRQQRQQERQQELGQQQITRLLGQLPALIQGGLSPEAAQALIASVAEVGGVEAPELDTSLFEKAEPSAREQLAPLLESALQGKVTPQQIEAAAPLLGVEPGAPTGLPPQSPDFPFVRGAGPRRLDPTVQQFQELAATSRAARPQEAEEFTLAPGAIRFRGREEIARGATKPAEEEDPLLTVGGGVGLRERILEDLRAGRTPQFAQPPQQRQPAQPRVNEQTVIGDVSMRGIPGMRPNLVGKPVVVQFQNGQPVRVLGQKPESADPFDQIIQDLMKQGIQPQRTGAQEEPGFLDRAMESVGSFFGGGEQQPSAPPARGGAPQVGSIVTHQGQRMRVVNIRPDGSLELEPTQ